MSEERVSGPSEPEMEFYLRQCGWKQAALYPMNWCDVPAHGPKTMVVYRLRQAVEIQKKRDLAMLALIQERLKIIEPG